MAKQLKIYTTENKEEEKFLRGKSKYVSTKEISSGKFKLFTKDLLYTARHSQEQDNEAADGIAAPQVGQSLRVFYIQNHETDKWQLFINPEVTPLGFLKITGIEGCLSVPNREGEVMRYKRVKVRYQDIDGKWKTEKFKDYNAVIIQHELDHLDGILFIDRLE